MNHYSFTCEGFLRPEHKKLSVDDLAALFRARSGEHTVHPSLTVSSVKSLRGNWSQSYFISSHQKKAGYNLGPLIFLFAVCMSLEHRRQMTTHRNTGKAQEKVHTLSQAYVITGNFAIRPFYSILPDSYH